MINGIHLRNLHLQKLFDNNKYQLEAKFNENRLLSQTPITSENDIFAPTFAP